MAAILMARTGTLAIFILKVAGAQRSGPLGRTLSPSRSLPAPCPGEGCLWLLGSLGRVANTVGEGWGKLSTNTDFSRQRPFAEPTPM